MARARYAEARRRTENHRGRNRDEFNSPARNAGENTALARSPIALLINERVVQCQSRAISRSKHVYIPRMFLDPLEVRPPKFSRLDHAWFGDAESPFLASISAVYKISAMMKLFPLFDIVLLRRFCSNGIRNLRLCEMHVLNALLRIYRHEIFTRARARTHVQARYPLYERSLYHIFNYRL